MRKLLILVILISTGLLFGQRKSSFFLQAGLYESFEDFKLKTSIGSIDFNESQLKNTLSTGYQLKYINGKRIKKAFAVSNGEKIFVRVNQMKKHFLEKNRGNPIDGNRDYSLAYLQNEKYLYFENFFYSTGTAILGAGAIHLRGIIYDSTKEKFIVFKYGNDIEEFLKTERPELIEKYDLSMKKIEIDIVRSIMLDFFKKELTFSN